jgi:hypothetical protein
MNKYFDKLEIVLSAFEHIRCKNHVGFLSDAYNLHIVLKNNNLKWDDILKYLEYRRELYNTGHAIKHAKLEIKQCPDCKNYMKLVPYENENQKHCYWLCNKCKYSEYMEKSFLEVVKEITKDDGNY